MIQIIFGRSASIIALLFCYSTIATAEQGDAEAGKQKAAMCAACHGADGNSVTPDFPNLAGQVPGYISAQLAKFKDGSRANPIMQGMSAGLSEQDMADLDEFYALQEPIIGSITPEQEAEALKGGAIYRGGYEPFEIAACMSCHGPSGHGIPPNFPRLSGQSAAYIEAQLIAFKSGAREDVMMNSISFALSEEQIKQLALFISALH